MGPRSRFHRRKVVDVVVVMRVLVGVRQHVRLLCGNDARGVTPLQAARWLQF
jgi:hypothetical protein